jgi:hypothetical protein
MSFECQIVQAWPPNVELLDAAFGVKSRPGTIFSWGPTRIYKPHGPLTLTQELWAHELVHGPRQGASDPLIEAWWRRYLDDVQFRFDEEWPAHVAEYKRFCARHADRNRRISYLMHTVAKRIASPLYGGIITFEEARKRLLAVR